MKKQKRPVLFVLEENPVYREIIPQCLCATLPESKIFTFNQPAEMLAGLWNKPYFIVSEYLFSNSDYNGEKILRAVKEKSPDTRVIFLTANHNLQAAIKALKAGATDYIPKSKDALDKLIRKSLYLKRHYDYVQKSNLVLSRLTAVLIVVVLVLLVLTAWYQLKK